MLQIVANQPNSSFRISCHHSPTHIYRVIRRRSSCRPHWGWQYPLPSHNHSARKNSVGMRNVRDQSHSIPFRITRRFLRS